MSFLKPLTSEQALQIVQTIMLDTSEGSTQWLNATFHELIKLDCHLPIIKLLLEDPRIKPNITDGIMTSMMRSNVELVELLIQNPKCNACINLHHLLKTASREGFASTVKILLQNDKVNPNCSQGYPIGLASQKGHTEVVKLLLEDPRVDPSIDRNFALWNACDGGHIEIVKILLQSQKVNPQSNDSRSIKQAMGKNHIDIVKLLIPRIDLSTITNVDILDIAKTMQEATTIQSIEQLPAIHKSESVLILEELFRNDKYGVGFFNNMFFNARDKNNLEVTEFLLKEKKVNSDICTNPTIKWIVKNNHVEIMKLLLELEKTVSSLTAFSGSLRKAVKNEHEEMVKLLLDNKNAVDNHTTNKYSYNSCVKLAFEKNLPSMVKLLATKADMTKIYDIQIHIMAK